MHKAMIMNTTRRVSRLGVLAIGAAGAGTILVAGAGTAMAAGTG
ncbi:MAG: hypothetical protein ACYDEN_04580 [Acidimicrobiales bacterium]